MIYKGEIFVCTDAKGAIWQLGTLPPPIGEVMLVSWKTSAAAVDAGVPQEIATIFIDAMLALGNILFPVAEPIPLADGDQILLKGRIPFRRMRLLSTRNRDSARLLFDDGNYPWWMQGQAAVLYENQHFNDSLTPKDFQKLFSDGWAVGAADLCARGAAAVIRPGVDGDVFGLFTAEVARQAAFSSELEKAAGLAGYRFRKLSETDLTSELAEG